MKDKFKYLLHILHANPGEHIGYLLFLVPALVYLQSSHCNILWGEISKYPKLSVMFFGTVLVSTLSFWLFSLFFLVIDLLKPKWALERKIQQKVVTINDYWKCLKQVSFNQFIVTPIFVYVGASRFGWGDTSPDIPNTSTILAHLFVFAVVEEILFYYFHRLLHDPSIYKYIHKKHHQFVAPIGLASTYCHPVEHLISNLIPVGLGPFLLKSHALTIWIFVFFANFTTVVTHGGYLLEGFPNR